MDLLRRWFLLGCVAAFTSPSVSGLEGEIVPGRGALRTVSILGSASQAASLAGPVLGSVQFDVAGSSIFYAVVAALFMTSQAIVLLDVGDRRAAPRSAGDGALSRIAEGIRYIASDQILIGSMALDLFAVFFGGATALLPVFATDILQKWVRPASACCGRRSQWARWPRC